MSSRDDSEDALERLLQGMAPADLELLAKALLRRVTADGVPVSITAIGGDAVGCAIGSGASLTARDLLTLLGRGEKNPLVQELVARMTSFPSPDAQDGAVAHQALARLGRELAARKLVDPASPDFGKTKYTKRMGFPIDQQRIAPIQTIGTFFALAPAPLIRQDSKPQFLHWMNCNERRYEPIDDCFFLPGPMPDIISKAHVWHNGFRQRFFPVVQSYFTYLAAEVEEGYLEYGFCPGSPLEQDRNNVYYAKVVGGFVAFLRFLRHFAEQFSVETSSISVGLAMTGTTGTRLRCISKRVMEHFLNTSPPETDGFRWVNAATPGTDWSVDRLARQAAVELLDHWSYVGPGWADAPEFTDGKYTGDYFLKDFRGHWL